MDWVLYVGLPIALTVLFIMHSYAYKQQKAEEGFIMPNLTACPAGLKQYTTNNSINCCDGDVVGNRCEGQPKCTLSASNRGIPRCAEYLKTWQGERGKRFCPPSMKNYYEIDGSGFCTAGAVRTDGRGPVERTARFCIVHKTIEKNMSDPDSCFNKKRLEEMKITVTKGPVQKMIIPGDKPGQPSYLGAVYGSGLNRGMCYDRRSMEQYLDVAKPTWRSSPDDSLAKQLADITYCS
jgi:hypothetical protein